jgi:hypothetical protein
MCDGSYDDAGLALFDSFQVEATSMSEEALV